MLLWTCKNTSFIILLAKQWGDYCECFGEKCYKRFILYCLFPPFHPLNIDGLVQKKSNSSALAIELRLSCTNQLTWCHGNIFCITVPFSVESTVISGFCSQRARSADLWWFLCFQPEQAVKQTALMLMCSHCNNEKISGLKQVLYFSLNKGCEDQVVPHTYGRFVILMATAEMYVIIQSVLCFTTHRTWYIRCVKVCFLPSWVGYGLFVVFCRK